MLQGEFQELQKQYLKTPCLNQDIIIRVNNVLIQNEHLQIDSKHPTFDHVLFDIDFLHTIKEARVSGLVCPLCHSGEGEHGTGELHPISNARLKCFSCKTTYVPLHNEDRESITLYLNNTLKKYFCQEKSEKVAKNFQDKVKELKIKALQIQDNLKIDIVKRTFCNRNYSKETIDNILHSDNLIINKEINCIYAIIYDNDLVTPIGLQKLSWNEEEKLDKFQVKDSSLNYTVFQREKGFDCIFICESITNALAIWECGFNAICCFTKNAYEQCYKIMLQNGKNPILFLDLDVAITGDYRSIDWERIKSSVSNLKSNADASDLLVLNKAFLSSELEYTFNLYYKKETFDNITFKQAYSSEATVALVNAEVGTGKTTSAIEECKCYKKPLFITKSKKDTEYIGKKLGINIVNSDIQQKDEAKGSVTTHARTALNASEERYDVMTSDESPDFIFIDEFHDLMNENDDVIACPYYNEDPEEDRPYKQCLSNAKLISSIEDQVAKVEMVAYSVAHSRTSIKPTHLREWINNSDLDKLQEVYLNEIIKVEELTTPEYYDGCIPGTNFYYKIIDCNSPFSFGDYKLDESLNKLISYDILSIKEELKSIVIKRQKILKTLRNFHYPLHLLFYKKMFLIVALPTLNGKPLSFSVYKQYVRNCGKVDHWNNESVYYKVHFRYVDYEPLANALKFARKGTKIRFATASSIKYADLLESELKGVFGENFQIYKIKGSQKIKGKKAIFFKIQKRLSDDEISKLLYEIKQIEELLSVHVTTTQDRADFLFGKQEEHPYAKNDFYSKANKDCFTTIEGSCSKQFDNVNKCKNKKENNDLIIYANNPLLQGSNELAFYNHMIAECDMFAPKISNASPFESLEVTINTTLKAKMQQILGRLMRNTEDTKIFTLIDSDCVQFDLVETAKERFEEVVVYENGKSYTYYKSPKDYAENLRHVIKGEEPIKYPCRIREKLTEEEKEENKAIKTQETEERRQERALNMVRQGATAREIQRSNHDYKQETAQQKLAKYKAYLNMHAPKGESPFSDDVLNAEYVGYDCEVYPNKYVICYGTTKDNIKEKVISFNTSEDNIKETAQKYYEWLCHFKELPLIGHNSGAYDNYILWHALERLAPNSPLLKDITDFNLSLKKLSDKRIKELNVRKEKCFKRENKVFDIADSIAKAIGYGDTLKMIAENGAIKGNHYALKAFQYDLGLTIKESPIPFDKDINSDEELQQVIEYCKNDVKTVLLMIEKYYPIFQAWKQLIKDTGLNGNYSKTALFPEYVYNRQLSYEERKRHAPQSEQKVKKVFKGYTIKQEKKGYCYYNVFDDIVYNIGKGGFDLLPKNVTLIDENGNEKQLENNHKLWKKVICLDIDSMHPNSFVNLNYVEEYTPYYAKEKRAKELCSLEDFKTKQEELAKLGYDVKTEKDIKALKNALKLKLNGTYGVTCLSYDSPLKKCEHNLIANYGGCYITTLDHELRHEFPGIQIVQIKTDSIKIAEYTEDIVNFCLKHAKKYGYNFKVEAKYKYLLTNGCEGIGIKENGEIVTSVDLSDDIENEQEEVKGSFSKLYDHEGRIRTKDNIETLVLKKYTKSQVYLGTVEEQNKKIVYKIVDEVNSHKVQILLPVKKGYGLIPFRQNKNGGYSAIEDLKGQEVISIYSKDELKTIDPAIIDYDYFQRVADKALDTMLMLIIEKKITDEQLSKLSNYAYEERMKRINTLLTSDEKYFLEVMKKKYSNFD